MSHIIGKDYPQFMQQIEEEKLLLRLKEWSN